LRRPHTRGPQPGRTHRRPGDHGRAAAAAGGAAHPRAPPSRIVTRHHDRPGAMMSFFSRWRRGRRDEPVDLDERSPQLGLRYRDLILLNEIAKRAADLSQPRHVVFYLYAPSHLTGQAIADEARLKGFDASVRSE